MALCSYEDGELDGATGQLSPHFVPPTALDLDGPSPQALINEVRSWLGVGSGSGLGLGLGLGVDPDPDPDPTPNQVRTLDLSEVQSAPEVGWKMLKIDGKPPNSVEGMAVAVWEGKGAILCSGGKAANGKARCLGPVRAQA